MRKTLIAFLFLPLFAFVTTEWVTITLDQRASIDFPSAAEPKDLNGNAMWLQDIGKDARCMVMILDFSRMGVDSAALADEMSRPEAFEQFKQGVVGQMQGASVLSEKNTAVNGHKVFEYLIDMGTADSSALDRMYNQNYFIGTKMYSLSFFEKNSKPQADLRKKFFSSFKVK